MGAIGFPDEGHGSNEGHAAMKAMGAPMATSKVAEGKFGKFMVFFGHKGKKKTKKGLQKTDLVKNKEGDIVSKKMQLIGKKAYKNIKGWNEAVVKARKALGLKGFVAVKKGGALYAKAKSFYK